MALTDLPKGHWMHGVAAKEKARLAKKKTSDRPTGKPAAMAGAGMVAAPVAGGLNVTSAPMPNC